MKSSRRTLRRLSRLAILFALASFAEPSTAVPIDTVVRVNHAREFNSLGNTLHEAGPSIEQGPPAKARVELGDPPNHKNFIGEPAFAEAYSAFQNDQATYWVSLNADNGRSPNDNGNGEADVHLVYAATKDSPDAKFTMHVTGGLLQLVDFDGTVPLFARVDLHVEVSGTQGIFSDFSAFAQLSGHGGQPFESTLDFRSEGLNVTAADFTEQRSGDTIVGSTLEIPASDIDVDLSRVFSNDVPISINVFLSAEVRSPGPESAATAFFRDPAHVDDVDPLPGSSSISVSGMTLLPATVPEPSTLALAAVGMATLSAAKRRRSV